MGKQVPSLSAAETVITHATSLVTCLPLAVEDGLGPVMELLPRHAKESHTESSDRQRDAHGDFSWLKLICQKERGQSLRCSAR